MTYQRIVLPFDLTGTTPPDPAALTAAVLAVAAPGAQVLLLPVVEPDYDLIARVLPSAGPPDQPLAESLRGRDRDAESLAAAVAAALACAGLDDTAARRSDAPLVAAALRAAHDVDADAIVLTLATPRERPWLRARGVPAELLAARAPASVAVVAIRPPADPSRGGAPRRKLPRPSLIATAMRVLPPPVRAAAMAVLWSPLRSS